MQNINTNTQRTTVLGGHTVVSEHITTASVSATGSSGTTDPDVKYVDLYLHGADKPYRFSNQAPVREEALLEEIYELGAALQQAAIRLGYKIKRGETKRGS